MLAYVFWHERRADADAQAYRSDAAELHRRLAASAFDGFAGSRTFAIDALPWRDGGGAFFEDWYVLRESSALDALEASAVSGDRSPPHDRLASAVAWGAGGLYRLRAGTAGGDQLAAQWFTKPAGMRYSELDAVLSAVVSPEHAVWQRRMVLGPGPEFCVAGPELIALPPLLAARTVRRELVAGAAQIAAAEPAGRLLMRERCMTCAAPLPWAADAMICSFECTYCPSCASATKNVCPDCGGELARRPRRVPPAVSG
jgi:hypothetical protein